MEFQLLLLILVLSTFLMETTTAFAAAAATGPSSSPNNNNKEIYGVPNSGWTSSSWNWGYANGTGHDCAAICRKQYATRQARANLVHQLQQTSNKSTPRYSKREPANFEEVKLVLALAWQKGRWDGSDGGPGGYGEILQNMADAKRYELGSEDECARCLVQDMQARFVSLNPNQDQLAAMDSLWDEVEPDADAAQRRCSALVLEAMRFIENGL